MSCGAEAPFTISEPHQVAYRPTCDAKGHMYGHSIEIKGVVICWEDSNEQQAKDNAS